MFSVVKNNNFFVWGEGVGKKLQFGARQSNLITSPGHPPLPHHNQMAIKVDNGKGNRVAGDKEGNGEGGKSDGSGNKV
jgi:hypothetical protein